MATVNTKSNLVTNLDATPRVANPLYLMGGVLREQVATVEIAAGDDANSIFRVARLHSSWRLSELTYFCDAITSGTDYNVGFYDTAENGGAVILESAISDAVSLATGIVIGTQAMYEAGSGNGVEDIEKRVWEMAGLSSDPGKFVDVCFKGITPGSGAGTLSVRTRYVANS